ncbi:Tat pathway signal protein, partial [Cereibacter changlensis JA139]
MFDLLIQGFIAVLSPQIFLLMTAGVAVGIVFGAVPGLTAVMAIALCLPMTYGLGPAAGISLLIALFVGATSGGLISAILLKIPGTPSSIATTFDGGPMMEKGEGAKALGVGIVFSFLGTIASVAALAFIAPSLAKVALSFGPHEYFAIAVFSLTLIATLSSGSMA